MKNLETFKNFVTSNCAPDVELEFESLYGYGNAPKEPTDEDWMALKEYYESEGLF